MFKLINIFIEQHKLYFEVYIYYFVIIPNNTQCSIIGVVIYKYVS